MKKSVWLTTLDSDFFQVAATWTNPLEFILLRTLLGRPSKLIFGMPPYLDPTRKYFDKKNGR